MIHPLTDIPELQLADGLIRIPHETDVPFTARVRALVDTGEFQRLQHISQLGLAARVYPGATHSRFEHALGVFHNAIRYLWQLGRDSRFPKTVDVHQAEVLLVAALLHDIGHWPFCHPIEDMGLPDLPPHEQFAAEFLSADGELAGVLQNEWGVAAEEVLDVLTPKTDSPALRLMRSILSGPIDIDKMDYLGRDSLHCGVPYGNNFDKNRLIQSLLINEAGDGLAISSKAKTAAELMVFARYVMFSEVYWHHAVRSATTMFARGFYELYRDIDLRTFFRGTDADVIAQLKLQSRGTAAERLLDGIFGPKRRLYKRIVEFSHAQDPDMYDLLARQPFGVLAECAAEMSRRLNAELNLRLDAADVLIDAPPPHREVELNVDLYYAKEGLYRRLSDVSPVVDALARRQFDDYVKRVRIFAHPDHAERLDQCPRLRETLAAAVRAVDTGT